MTRDDFIKIVETYGVNPGRWPQDQRAQAKKFMNAHPDEAAIIMDADHNLDHALETARLTPGTDMLKARIKSAAQSTPQTHIPNPASSRRGFGYRAMAAMVLAAFSLGFAGANLMNSAEPETITQDTTYQLADNNWEDIAEDYGFSEIYEWVEQTDTTG